MRGPKVAPVEKQAPPTRRPSRIVRNQKAGAAALPVETPARERNESLASLPGRENGAEDMAVDFAPIKDRAETEQMTVVATAPSPLEDYGAVQE